MSLGKPPLEAVCRNVGNAPEGVDAYAVTFDVPTVVNANVDWSAKSANGRRIP
jgi:hypothetical protein